MSLRELTPLQQRVYTLIFGTETPSGKWFDILLIVAIVTSVLVILLDSIQGYHDRYGLLYWRIEWMFTVLFTVEFAVPIWCTPNRRAYLLSFYGLVDLMSILPTYIAVLVPGAGSLLMIRLLRILRIFRVLRLLEFLSEANILAGALRRSARKISIFFSLMIIITTIFGCLMYVVEGPENGFHNIPESIYWAVVTVTTVGYGDLAPHSPMGRAIAAVGMLTGYAIIAVPTGIITAELTAEAYRTGLQRTIRNCRNCARAGHEADATHCKYCGAELGSAQ